MSGINLGGDLFLIAEACVPQGAIKSETRVEGKIINLDEKARSEVSPKLLIGENDIKASHGASLGSYNDNDFFYLISRGLDSKEAKSLITYGIIIPLLNSIQNDKLKEIALNQIKEINVC